MLGTNRARACLARINTKPGAGGQTLYQPTWTEDQQLPQRGH